jgi:hypothetical protein
MKASKNTAAPRQGGGVPALHRVDPERVAEALSAGNEAGYARLNLMLGTVLDRLVGHEPAGLQGP